MNNQTKKLNIGQLTNKVTSLLYQTYKNHPTMIIWAGGTGDNWRWKKVYLRKVAFSLVNFALYGKCMMAPEDNYEYLKWVAKDYEEPKVKFKGVFAIDPEREEHLEQIDNILKKQMHDMKLDVRDTINNIINIILSNCTQN